MLKKQVRFFIIVVLLSFWLVIQFSAGWAEVPPGDRTVREPTALIAAGKRLFAEGKFAAAVQVWQESADQFDRENNQPQQALALNYVALGYQQLEQWVQAETAISNSWHILAGIEEVSLAETAIMARILNTAGSIQLNLGRPEAALDNWQQATIAYQEIGDTIGILGSQMNQAIALQILGMYGRSQTLLNQVVTELASQPNSRLKAQTLNQLGVILRLTGNLPESQTRLWESLSLIQEFNDPETTSAILLNLGNTLRDLSNEQGAIIRYQQAAQIAPTLNQKLTAQIDQLSLLIQINDWQNAQDLYATIQSTLNQLDPSHLSVKLRVNLADNLLKVSPYNWKINPAEIAEILTTAIQEARTLADPKAESYALGTLGKLSELYELIYEQNQQEQNAQKITEQALLIAQQIKATDLIARWQWQLGRVLANQGNRDGAISAYTEAVKSIQALRYDLVNINRNVQLYFTETVEPVYRELVRLLVQDSTNPASISRARETIEALQLAEIDDFFHEACLEGAAQQIDQIDRTAAVIYPIILSDRMAVILALNGQPLTYYETLLPETEIDPTLEQFQIYLNPAFFDSDRLQVSQTIYSWLIRPVETKLAASGVETLVFVLDGALRNLPMAALYDGQQYLIEKYSVALAPGLQLLNVAPLNQEKLGVLLGGLSAARGNFSALPAVETEVTRIAQIVKSDLLLNQKFTKSTLAEQVNVSSLPVVHIATHGQFSSQLEDTFIVAWDGKINVQEFNHLLRSRQQQLARPLELLVLSACQTAAGDRRAALGLAGLAVRSGVRSTLATLWQVNDNSTAKLMVRFYQELAQQPHTSKAKALRTAQLALLKDPQFQHPFYWAPFVLLGNWL